MSIEDKINLIKKAEAHELAVFADDPDDRVQKMILSRQDCPPEVLRKLAGSASISVRVALATNPALPFEDLRQISLNYPFLIPSDDFTVATKYSSKLLKDLSTSIENKETETILEDIKKMPNIPENILSQLSQDKDESSQDKGNSARFTVVFGRRCNCPEDILIDLSSDKCHIVRAQVGLNINSPEDVLRKLSRDKCDSVRSAVALNPNSPEDVLRKLSRDKCDSVRSAVALNSNCPEDVLGVLMNDNEKSVAEAVLRKSELGMESEIGMGKLPISVIKIGLEGRNKDLVIKWLEKNKKSVLKDILDLDVRER